MKSDEIKFELLCDVLFGQTKINWQHLL